MPLPEFPWEMTLPGPRRAPPAQADRRALNITLNSIGTELTRDDRKKLYSNFGLLYPHGQMELAVAEDFDQIRQAMERVPPYHSIFTKVRGCWGTCPSGFKRPGARPKYILAPDSRLYHSPPDRG